VFCWKNTTAGIYVKARNTYIPSHAPGVSDILGVLKGGRFLAIEVKAAKGRVSPHQQLFLDSINGAGGLAFVARSVEEVKAQLI
jgi:predicted RecB family endonuclease